MDRFMIAFMPLTMSMLTVGIMEMVVMPAVTLMMIEMVPVHVLMMGNNEYLVMQLAMVASATSW